MSEAADIGVALYELPRLTSVDAPWGFVAVSCAAARDIVADADDLDHWVVEHGGSIQGVRGIGASADPAAAGIQPLATSSWYLLPARPADRGSRG